MSGRARLAESFPRRARYPPAVELRAWHRRRAGGPHDGINRVGCDRFFKVEGEGKIARGSACGAFIARKKRQNLAAAALRGSQRALELVDSPSERTSIEATKLVLAIDGYRPETSPLVNINLQGDLKAGYIIDLSDVDRSSPDILEGEVMRDESSAAQALDSKLVAKPTSYQPDSRWAQTVTTPAPAEPGASGRGRLRARPS